MLGRSCRPDQLKSMMCEVQIYACKAFGIDAGIICSAERLIVQAVSFKASLC